MSAKSIMTAMTMNLIAATAAFAADTHKVYSSGILVLIFIGFVALVVVVQMIPAIIALCGMIKGMVADRKSTEVRSGN